MLIGDSAVTMSDTSSATTHARLKTPRAAALAGIVSSLLLICSFWILRRSLPSNPQDSGIWLQTDARAVVFSLNLIPFSGLAFLWFIGVLRDRLGSREDRFVATVFLGSGLLFLGMIFIAASAIGGLILAYQTHPELVDSATFAFVRSFTFDIMNVYAFRMAAIFMVTTSTLALLTQVMSRWISIVGYIGAVFLFLGSSYFSWGVFIFPSWILLVSVFILIANLRGKRISID